jgi:hypothetical protein
MLFPPAKQYLLQRILAYPANYFNLTGAHCEFFKAFYEQFQKETKQKKDRPRVVFFMVRVTGLEPARSRVGT